jgi:hypothetical protein
VATWIVFGEAEIGRVDAPHRDAAEAVAAHRFGYRAVRRVQSAASFAIGEEERRAAEQRRRLPNNDAEADGA